MRTASAFFDLRYQGYPLEKWLGVHEAFKEGPSVGGSNLWMEFSAYYEMGIDPEIGFAKSREMRALITGGHIAKTSLAAMIHFDLRPKGNK